ncbi:hypothetical protein [Yimella sp. cx-51]|uniref:hypothetical protein n=1 Tax=Yimella sp. cx-51 TaxID=2770551 RepID=UPI00165DFB71|nr:hypothetical protein [Yimella sp. cx-51]MBC9958215.1 hypothetical protein [Yimella sp. cx-51]QTH38752.1 hypothetical protein J5M86_03685 [Yimella sp. cx-51]
MRRSMWPVALVALLVVDALLIFWALRPAGEPSGLTSSTSSSSSSSASSSPSSTASGDRSDRVIVVASGATSAWRIMTGATCSGAASAQLTTDSGKSWNAAPKLPLKAVFSASGSEAGNALLSGLDASCKPVVVELSRQSAEVTDSPVQWSVNPIAADLLLHDGEATEKACESGQIRDLASDTAQRANVLCDGGVIRRTTDAGATWKTVGTVKEATGIASGSAASDYKVYVASTRECGVRVAPLADELAGTASGCVDGTRNASAADITMWGSMIWIGDSAGGWVTRVEAPAPSTSSESAPSTSSTSSSSTTTESAPTSTQSPVTTQTQQSTTAPAWTPSTTTRTRTRSTQTWTPPATTTNPSGSWTSEPSSTGAPTTSTMP